MAAATSHNEVGILLFEIVQILAIYLLLFIPRLFCFLYFFDFNLFVDVSSTFVSVKLAELVVPASEISLRC